MKNKGFTLIETIIVISISTFVSLYGLKYISDNINKKVKLINQKYQNIN